MSERVVRIDLSELQTVRVRCLSSGCAGVVVELPLDQLGQRYGLQRCPLCGASFDPLQSGTRALADLGKAVGIIRGLSKVVRVELVLPETPPAP